LRPASETPPISAHVFVARHYGGADVDTIIIGTASDPWSTDYVDTAAKPSGGTLPK
jgi:hypothetical protein